MTVIGPWRIVVCDKCGTLALPNPDGTGPGMCSGCDEFFPPIIEVAPTTTTRGAVSACEQAAFLFGALGHGGEHENCDPCAFVRAHHPAGGQ